jgi:hypothetical protein
MVKLAEKHYHAGTVDCILFLVDLNVIILGEDEFTSRFRIISQEARKPHVHDITNHSIT